MTLPSVLEIETAGLLAWPGLEAEWDGRWVRRAANGYTKRANSVQCLDPDDDADLEARIEASRNWFAARGLPTVFRLTPLSPPRLRDILESKGWHLLEPSCLLAMPLQAFDADARVRVLPIDDPAFVLAQQALQGYDEGTLGKLKAVLDTLDMPACGIVADGVGGEPVASALMNVVDGIAFTGNVVTAVAERRKGHAGATLRAGLAWAHGAGARFAALNVVADNAPARALYASLGYAHRYDYSYWRAPQ